MMVQNYINVSYKESLFEYYEVIISWGDQMYHKAVRALLDLIKPRPKLSPHNVFLSNKFPYNSVQRQNI